MQEAGKTGKEERVSIPLNAQENNYQHPAPTPCNEKNTRYFQNKTKNSEVPTQSQLKEHTPQNNNPTTNKNSNYANESYPQAAKTILIHPESTPLPSSIPIWGYQPIVPIHQIREDTQNKNAISNNYDATKKINEIISENNKAIALQYLRNQLLYEQIIPLDSVNFKCTLNWDAIPRTLNDTCEILEQAYRIDKIGILIAILGCLSIATRGRLVVRLNEQWTEPLIDYILLASESGTRKSSLIQALKHPFDDFINEHTLDIENFSKQEIKNRIIDRAKSKLISKATTNLLEGINTQGTPKNIDAILEHDSTPIMLLNERKKALAIKPTIFAGTISKQKLALTLSEQGECVSWLEAEGTFFESSLKKDDSHLDLLLKGHSMDAYDDYYAGRKRLSLKKPALPMVHFVQNRIIRILFKNNKYNELGLNARFSPYFCKQFNSQENDHNVINTKKPTLFRDKIKQLLNMYYTQSNNRHIHELLTSSEGFTLAKKFEQKTAYALNNAENQYMKPYLRKAHGQAIRFAGDLHLWNQKTPHESIITTDEIHGGIAIMNIMYHHARFAFDPGGLQGYHDAQTILNFIRRNFQHATLEEFSSREIQQNIRGIDKDRANIALNILEKHNYVRQWLGPKRQHIFIVHPRAFD